MALRHLQLVTEGHVLADVRTAAAHLAGRLAEAIAPLDAVGAIRQHGLMVGVELAPSAEGLRWGRRVCAGAVERGVLLRPLGDVVVLMPPLTITEDELDRIVTVLGEAIAEVAGP